jgi:CRP/FNR family transcriptional regulator, cyclic AMP receptor protein
MARALRILEADPDLGRGIEADRLDAAQAACIAAVARVPRGRWRPARESARVGDGFGLLVLKGLLSRRVGHDGRFGAELLGPGDLVRPWDRIAAEAIMPFEANWSVIRPAHLAILDRRFASRAAPYPGIAAELIRRVLQRSRQAMLSMAIVHQPRVETRVEMLLWVLADRWATVRPDGVALRLPLTHALLAELVAASRPTVSAAVSALTKSGKIRREGDTWLLLQQMPAALEIGREGSVRPE